jgi:hypothetical protein
VGYGGDSGSISDIEKADLVGDHRQQHGRKSPVPGSRASSGRTKLHARS